MINELCVSIGSRIGKSFDVSDNHILLTNAYKNEQILYDCYGHIIKIINQPSNSLFNIHDGYYINILDRKIQLTNIKTLEKSHYDLNNTDTSPYTYTYTIKCNNFIWTKQKDDYYAKIDILTGLIVKRIRVPINGAFQEIADIGNIIYIQMYINNKYTLIIYRNGNIKTSSLNPSAFLYNRKCLVLYNRKRIIIYNSIGKRKIYNISTYYLRLNEKYIIFQIDSYLHICNLNMQTLYKLQKPDGFVMMLYKFIAVQKRTDRFIKLTIYRLRPDSIIYIKTKMQNTLYWNILRML